MAKFEIKNRFTGAVQFSCEIDAEFAGKSYSLQLGFAVKKAVESRADLSGADLSGANLSGADLSRADLSHAYLYRADLSGADLSGANLSGAKDAELTIARTRILPEGALIGWKKLRQGVIAKLRIPEDAKRCHAFGRKCRAEYVDVIELFGGDVGISLHDGKTEYRAGQRVTPDSFDENWQDECSNGIHFYISRAEAEAHS